VSHPQAHSESNIPYVEDQADPCAGLVQKTPLLKARARMHRYFIRNGRLYYILEVRTLEDIYLIENCGTECTMWVSGYYLSKGVKWIARSRSSGVTTD
jgi:hypothetical protein